MNNIQQNHIVVVLGMHRSGTSVITRGLQVLDVDLGNHLMPSAPGVNEKGFWEDLDVNALNIDLLRALGHDWHTLTPVSADELAAPAVGEFKLRAVEVLRNKLSTTNRFGLKDPRISRLLPFWQDVFAHLQVRVSYVIACRNPMSVARSLAKRDGFDLEKGYYLWLEHMLQSLAQTANQPRLVVDYDRLMEDPAGQLQRIAQNLGLTFDPESPEFAEYRNQFLEDSLRHTRYRAEDLHLDKAVPPIVIELYKAFVELAADAVQFDHREVVSLLRRINAQFRENYPALHYMQACDERSTALAQQVAERDGRLAQLQAAVEAQQQTLAERDGQLNGLTQAVSERDGRLAELDKVVTELEDGIAAVLRAMSDSEEEIHHLARILHGLEGEQGPYAGLVRALIERNHQIAGLRESVRERDERAAALAQQVAERDGRLAQLQAAVEAQQQTLAERDGQLNSLTQAVTERDAHLAATARQLHALQESLQEAQKRIQAMERSRSWRMTAPYRWIGTALRFVSNYIGRKTPFSRPVVALLLLPAAFVFYGGIFRFFGAWRRDKGVFAKVIAGQALIRERLLSRSRLVRRFVFACFSLAVRIQRAGSVKRSLGSFFRIIRTEGLGGIRGRMITTAPGMTAAPVPVGEGRPAELPVLAKEVARRILVADYRVPRPDVSAGERATVGILQDLCALGYEVVFLPNDMVPSPRYEAGLRAAGVQLVTRESGFDYSAQYLEKHGSEFGAFYLIRVDVAEALLPIARKVAPDARIIFHAPDLYFLREMREAVLRNDPAARERAMQTRDRELAMMSRSDRVVVVSPAEVPVLREVLPDTPISVFSVLYAPVVENPRPYAKRKNIFFLGGFGHPPNVNAVQWFAAEVWPHVRKALPKVEFHIIGAEAPGSVLALGKLPGIKVVGFVPELEPVLETLRVGVAPLQYGAGIKGKVATAMGAGIPCVCTEIAAEGMGIKNDVHALVENDPVRFAQAIVTLYNDEKTWSRLSSNGQSLVQEKYGDAANRASLLKVLDQAQALPISLFVDYCQAAKPVAVPNPGAEAEVDVSIIIPVYNKWNLTRACLTSVVQTSVGSGVTYEVILADDGSTDETIRAAEMFPGLRIVKTPKNLGFLRNCNNAAKHARGRHILLLNNDTVVLPGWLESLYRTMEQDPSIAIVGSKLLYPDGVIQEAGACILRDGSGYNAGRGLSRYAPEFNFAREVDYISGASIMVRKTFWERVSGFDESYRNAYCEDADLAMTARKSNMRVVYEPESEVVHFEHGTYADQLASNNNKELQAHNTKILVEKWKTILESDHLHQVSEEFVISHAERHAVGRELRPGDSQGVNILYFSPFPSHPDSHGNRATIKFFGATFKKLGHKVHFVVLNSADVTEAGLEQMRSAWDSVEVMPFRNPMLATGDPIAYDGWYEQGLGERIKCICYERNIDMVFCSYVFQSKLLEFVPRYVLKVIDTHDKMGDRYEMLRKNGQPLEFFSCSQEEESAYLHRADVVIARREEEAIYFDSITTPNRTIIIPHFEDPCFISKSFSRLEHVGVVASANRINLVMVREFLVAIDRALAGRTCPFTLHIAGQVKDMAESLPASESAIFKRPWVRMHGFVPEIAQFYGDMDVVVSPVTMGTGINVKTVQAMAFGMPLLTTVCGSKGIETGEPMHLHANLDELASSIFALLMHPEDLNRLAALSRSRYLSFNDEALSGFSDLVVMAQKAGDRSLIWGDHPQSRHPVNAAQSNFALLGEHA